MSDNLIIGNRTMVEDRIGINVTHKLLRSTKIKIMNIGKTRDSFGRI